MILLQPNQKINTIFCEKKGSWICARQQDRRKSGHVIGEVG